MNFSTVDNTAGIVAAGRAGAGTYAKMLDVQRKSAPDFTGLAKVAMDNETAITKAGIKAEEAVTRQGVKAVGDLQSIKVNLDGKAKVRGINGELRKAGGLAAIGKIAGAGYLAATDNTKGRERPKGDLQGLYDSWKTKHDGIKDRHKSESDAMGDYKPGTFEAPDSTVGGGSGKVTGGTTSGSSLSGDQKTVADAIAKYESGDWGYEAFNQGGAEGGTKVLGKSGSYKNTYGSSLTDMTLGEIFHKQNTKQRGLSMDEHISSGGLHAVGRYQFIGSTLQDEVKRMGLSPDTKFTPQVQDNIFLSHIKRVGNISPWVGPSNNYSSGQKQEFNSMISNF